MWHAVHDVAPLDGTGPRRAWHQRNRTALINALMWSRTIVVVDIRRENLLQMALIQDHQLVQALLANRADPAFGTCVRILCPNWRPDDPHVL